MEFPLPRSTRYQPIRLLGRGGMGAVYEVEDATRSHRVALKVMLGLGPRQLIRFKQEFRLLSDLAHPNMVGLYDLGVEGEHWYYTMELVRGRDLRRTLVGDDDTSAVRIGDTLSGDLGEVQSTIDPCVMPGNGVVRCDLDQLPALLGQLVDALEYIHGHGVVHRDLKPSNVLVEEGGRVVLLDFGLARAVDRSQVVTREGAPAGTLAYMAPEQLTSAELTPATDRFALGCVLFELITGKPPHAGSLGATLASRLHFDPPRVEDFVEDAPVELASLCARLMSRDPHARPSLDEVRATLGTLRPHTTPVGRSRGPALPFVGREAELATLEARLEAVAQGVPQTCLVTGESGVGKSALAERLVRRARARGFLCFKGRCYERELVPYMAFDRIVDAMVLTLTRWPAEMLDGASDALERLEQVFPVVGLLLDKGRAADLQSDPFARARQAFRGLPALMRFCQGRAPLLLVLDDLQWVDAASVDLLRVLIDGLEGRVLVLGLARPGATEPGHPIADLPWLSSPDDHSRHLPLEPLSGEVTAQLFSAATRQLCAADLPPEVATLVGGNPMLTILFADLLATLDPADRAERIGRLRYQDMATTLVETLPPELERLLALAAVAGGRIDRQALCAASGLGSGAFEKALGELQRARMLRAVAERRAGDDTGRTWLVEVHHDRIREAVYDGLAPERRQELHRGLARALDQTPGGAEQPEILVWHWGMAGDDARRRRFALVAAERANDQMAFASAARLLTIAQEPPPVEDGPAEVAARWERIALLWEGCGRLGPAIDAARRALAIWEAEPESDRSRLAVLRLHQHLSQNLNVDGRIAEARALMASTLALIGRRSQRAVPLQLAMILLLTAVHALLERLPRRWIRARPTALVRQQVALLAAPTWALVWPLLARELALRASIESLRIDDERQQFRQHLELTLARSLLGQLEPGDRRAAEALDRAEALAAKHRIPAGGEIVQVYRSLPWIAADTARALKVVEGALDGLARQGLEDSHDGIIGRLTRLQVRLVRGEPGPLIDSCDRELRRLRRGSPPWIIARVYQVDGLLTQGRLAEVDAALEELAPLVEELSGSVFVQLVGLRLCRRATWVGDFRDALHIAADHRRRARSTGALIVGLHVGWWTLAGVQAWVGLAQAGDLDRGEWNQAARWARWLARRGQWGCDAMGERALALLEHIRGRPDAARDHLRQALVRSTVNGSAWFRWRCLETARELGMLNRELELEAAELSSEHGFVVPDAISRG